jgi:hypothetical protein
MDLPPSYKGTTHSPERSPTASLSLNGSSIVHFASGSQHLLLIASREVNNSALSMADGMQYRNAWTPPPRIYPES